MILCIDPGLNIGLSYRFDNLEWATTTLAAQPDWDLNMSALVRELMQRTPNTIVIESFVGRQMFSAYGIETVEMIGAVRGICLGLNIHFVKQTPAQRMTQVPNAKLLLEERKRALGASHGFKFTVHEVSSLAHLLTYERRIARGSPS